MVSANAISGNGTVGRRHRAREGDAIDKSELDAARDALLELRQEIAAEQATAAGADDVVELDQSKVGRLSRMDAMQAQAMARASAERRSATLQRVSAALKRFEAGDYGNCTACDEPIDPRRLEFDPAAAVCISCAGKLEQG